VNLCEKNRAERAVASAGVGPESETETKTETETEMETETETSNICETKLDFGSSIPQQFHIHLRLRLRFVVAFIFKSVAQVSCVIMAPPPPESPP